MACGAIMQVGSREMLRSRLATWRFERALGALRSVDIEAIQAYAAASWPAPSTPADQAPYLALDFELDGLTRGAYLLQAGWLSYTGDRIVLKDAVSLDIRSYAELNAEAVTIHGIGEQRAAQGEPVSQVLLQLTAALGGRIMVAHCAEIEQTALQHAIRKMFKCYLPVRMICTLTLERRIHPNLVGQDAYRLAACRERYGLPDYPAHDALTDAIAAAELLQAQISRLPPGVTLEQLEYG